MHNAPRLSVGFFENRKKIVQCENCFNRKTTILQLTAMHWANICCMKRAIIVCGRDQFPLEYTTQILHIIQNYDWSKENIPSSNTFCPSQDECCKLIKNATSSNGKSNIERMSLFLHQIIYLCSFPSPSRSNETKM